MSIPASSQEAKVSTFVTPTAVIKFSGGSVGTDEWTDSEDEEGLDAGKVPGGQTASTQRNSDAVNHNSHLANEKASRNSTGLTKNGDIIANGSAGVRHKHLQEPGDAHALNSHGGENDIQDRKGLDQKIGNSNSYSTARGSESSSLHWNDHERQLPLNPNSMPSEHNHDTDGHSWREESYENIMNPFAEVPQKQTGAGVLQTDDGTSHHSNEDRPGQSSFDTDLDISLPSEDQDLALITDEDLGIAENHFSQPEGFFGFSRLEELELAIETCKEAVKRSREHSEARRKLVAKLVQLRLKLLEIKDSDDDDDNEETKVVLGHRFLRMKGKSLNDHCEVCLSVIWALLQAWYKCTECNFGCHRKCLNMVKRQCVSTKISKSCFDLNISPEKGLSAQNYRCAECRAPLAFNGVQSEPRLCDYSGLYYCHLCHWNDLEVIPARVIHNWDFEPRKVSRQSRQLLKLMHSKAVLRIQDLNPMLFNYVEELSQIKKLRGEILIMKVYFLSCRQAMEGKLLKELQSRPHFVENSDMYSLQDLIDTEDGVLLAELASIHGNFAVHIRVDCQLCQAKGFICELCNSSEVIFPFDMIATVCAKCSAVYHRDCYYKRSGECPKCTRMSRRVSADHQVTASPARPIRK